MGDKSHSIKYQIVINIIWSGIAGTISYGINLLIIPAVSERIGIEAYGFIGLADTFISYINLITVALNAFAARYIALYFHKGDYRQANIFYNSVLVSNIILSVILFIPCTGIIYKIEKFIEVPLNIIGDVKLLFIFVLINYLVNILGTAFCAVVFIKNKTNIIYRNKAIQSIVYIAVLILLIHFWSIRLYFFAGVQVLASCVALFLNKYYSKKIVPELRVNMKDFSWSSVKKMISSGIWTSFNNIGNILNTGLDLLFCNKLLTPLIMGQLSVVNQISTLMKGVTMLVINAFQPKQLEAYAKEENAKLQKLLNFSMKLASVMGSTFFIVFFAKGKNFLKLWLPTQDITHIFSVCIVVLVGEMVVIVTRPLYYVYTLTDRLRRIFWITIVSGICNVISMLILVPYTSLGVYAVVGSTAVLNTITNIGTVLRVARYLRVRRMFFVPTVVRHVTGCILGASIFGFLTYETECTTWKELIILCGICGVAAVIFNIIVQFIFTDEGRIIKNNMISYKVERKK